MSEIPNTIGKSIEDVKTVEDDYDSDSASSVSSLSSLSSNDSLTDSDDCSKPKRPRLADGNSPNDGRCDIDSDDDSIVVSTIESKVRKSINPDPITAKSIVSCFSFSAADTLIAVGTVKGEVDVYDYDFNKHLKNLLDASKSITAIEWAQYSANLYVSCGDKICRVNVEKKTKTIRNVDHPVTCIKMSPVGSITGDESGTVAVWDDRTFVTPVLSMREIPHCITSMCIEDWKVAATLCTGTVVTFDIRRQDSAKKSEYFPVGFNSCEFYKSGTKLVCGANDGHLVAFGDKDNYGDWEYHYKPIETASVINCMVAITDEIALTGMDDGTIRATYLYPMRRLGIVASTEQITGKQNDAVSWMDVSSYGFTVGVSCATDKRVLMLNTSCFDKITPSDPKYNSDYYFRCSDRCDDSESSSDSE